jgi:hypothetical protein
MSTPDIPHHPKSIAYRTYQYLHLKAAPATAEEISAITGDRKGSVQSALYIGFVRGDFIRTDTGTYEISPPLEEVRGVVRRGDNPFSSGSLLHQVFEYLAQKGSPATKKEILGVVEGRKNSISGALSRGVGLGVFLRVGVSTYTLNPSRRLVRRPIRRQE